MDDETRRRFQNPDLDHLEQAKERGNLAPLAEYIRAGFPITQETRDWIADYLIGNREKKRVGVKRSRKKELEDFRLLLAVSKLILKENLSEYKATLIVAAQNEKSPEYVKAAIRRLPHVRKLLIQK